KICSISTKTIYLRFIVASSHPRQPTPRIGSPPATAIGRAHVRNQGNAGGSKSSQGSSEQPPLLDLLCILCE
ncbi:hypothetical protein BHM03_00060606, partial [Ensete ventricosum]